MSLHGYAGCVAALASIFFGLTAATPSIAVAYCASINTASTSANSSTFQSEGLCFDFCNDDGYALGVLQDEDCWCSNYVPATGERVATSKWCVSATLGPGRIGHLELTRHAVKTLALATLQITAAETTSMVILL